jgi:hypothetical protein
MQQSLWHPPHRGSFTWSPCCPLQLPRTLYSFVLFNSCRSLFAWLVVHRLDSHGLLIILSLIYSSSRKHSTFRTLVVGRSVAVGSLFTWSRADCIDNHGLLVVAALALLCSPAVQKIHSCSGAGNTGPLVCAVVPALALLCSLRFL